VGEVAKGKGLEVNSPNVWSDGIAANQGSNSGLYPAPVAQACFDERSVGMNEWRRTGRRHGCIVPDSSTRRPTRLDQGLAGDPIAGGLDSPGAGWAAASSVPGPSVRPSLRWRFSSALRFFASSRCRFSYE
jgi:hypothetical protein